MTPEERATKIAEIQRAQKISEIRAAGADPNQPGTEAIGSPEGPQSLGGQALHLGAQGLGATAKGLDVLRGSTTGPALALALKAFTGKDVASLKDWGNSVNPTNLGTFPTSNEMFEKAGVPAVAKMSDYFNFYSDPKNSQWFSPDKGGALDWTVRGAGGLATDMAIDPMNWLSFGASGLAKAEANSVVKQLTREGAGTVGKMMGKAGDAINMASKPIQKIAGAVKDIPYAGPVMSKMATAPSDAVDWLGKKLYDSTILPIEHEGAKYGKEAVGQTLHDAGIWNPLNLTDKVDKAKDQIFGARNKILGEAGDAGGRVDMAKAMERAKQTVASIRAEGRPKQQWIADQIEKEIAEHEAMVAGKEGAPAIGIPATPGREIKPAMGSQLKSDIYAATPDAAWNELKKTPEGAQVMKPLSQGLREETLSSVERGLGPEAAAKIAELDAEGGKLLSTANSTRNVEKQADRLAHGSVVPTGTGKVMGIMHGGAGVLMDMAGNAARLGTMPTGYFLRKLAEGQLTGPMIDSYLRRQGVENFNQGAQNGQN